jgi:hypothetical protein
MIENEKITLRNIRINEYTDKNGDIWYLIIDNISQNGYACFPSSLKEQFDIVKENKDKLQGVINGIELEYTENEKGQRKVWKIKIL